MAPIRVKGGTKAPQMEAHPVRTPDEKTQKMEMGKLL